MSIEITAESSSSEEIYCFRFVSDLYFTHLRVCFFTQELADGFSLESERQQDS